MKTRRKWIAMAGLFAALTMVPGASSNNVYLTPGDDYWVDVDGNYATVRGYDGNDILKGQNKADDLSGDSGRDNVQGGDGDDIVKLGAGDDQGYGGYGDDELRDQDGATNGYLDGGGGYNRCFGDWNRYTDAHDAMVNCDESTWQLVG